MSLKSFLPFIVFAALAGAAWQWAAAAAFVIAVRLLVQERKAGTPNDALILQYSNCAYFAALAAVAFAAPHSELKHYCGALSFAWIGGTMASTLAVHRPFTLGIARRKAPQEVWNSPWFLRMNVVITAVWGVSFLVTAVVLAILVAAHTATVVVICCQVVGFAIPAVFTHRYPTIVRNRVTGAVPGNAASAL
jgi:hypothetical protein